MGVSDDPFFTISQALRSLDLSNVRHLFEPTSYRKLERLVAADPPSRVREVRAGNDLSLAVESSSWEGVIYRDEYGTFYFDVTWMDGWDELLQVMSAVPLAPVEWRRAPQRHQVPQYVNVPLAPDRVPQPRSPTLYRLQGDLLITVLPFDEVLKVLRFSITMRTLEALNVSVANALLQLSPFPLNVLRNPLARRSAEYGFIIEAVAEGDDSGRVAGFIAELIAGDLLPRAVEVVTGTPQSPYIVNAKVFSSGSRSLLVVNVSLDGDTIRALLGNYVDSLLRKAISLLRSSSMDVSLTMGRHLVTLRDSWPVRAVMVEEAPFNTVGIERNIAFDLDIGAGGNLHVVSAVSVDHQEHGSRTVEFDSPTPVALHFEVKPIDDVAMTTYYRALSIKGAAAEGSVKVDYIDVDRFPG